jgi:penicillin-binding protein 1A
MNSLLELIRKLLKTFTVAIVIAATVGLGVGIFFVYRIVSDLPEVSRLKDFQHPVATQVFSSDGRLIGEFTTQRRYKVAYGDIPDHVKNAFVAAEDSNFYKHGGIDMAGIARAIFSNILRGRYAQGGSTITQQVARSILLASREKKLTRKFREIILALRMEDELSKEEILNLYLNEIYLGHGAFGIGAAAHNYFHKKVKDLTVAEGAMLAGLPQRPNEWTPFRNPHLAKKRQHYVMRRMLDENFITEQQYQAANQQPLKMFTAKEINSKEAPYFTEYVRQYLMNKYGSENVLTQGFKIYTTVHYDMQKVAEKTLVQGLAEVDQRLGWRGVKERVETREQMQELAGKIHESVLGEITEGRILPPTADDDFRKLIYDLEPLQSPTSPYFGITPIREQESYKAFVTAIEVGKEPRAVAQVGETQVFIPWSAMLWTKPKDNPSVTLDNVLKVGDVIAVKIERIDRKAGKVEASLQQTPEVQAALLSFELQTGAVRAMVGGRDFEESEFNCALQAKRQVGSTCKPMIYAAALDKGFSPSSLVTDSPIVFKFEGELDTDNVGEDWRPHNYEGSFKGDVPLRQALIRSMNIPTVKILNEITVNYGIEYARRLGITAALPRDLSIALGSWSSSLEELTRAYAVFPRLGKKVQLHYIRQVVNSSGEILEDYAQAQSPYLKGVVLGAPKNPPPPVPADAPENQPVMSPQTAYVLTDILRGVVREGTGRRAMAVPGPVAGKTGTSNDHRDAWFVGYTPSLMTGVWLGYLKDKPLDSGETGGRAATPIWTDFMRYANAFYPRTEFPIPDDVVFAYVDKNTGKLATSQNPNRVRVAFKAGTVPDRTGENLPRIGEPGARAQTIEIGSAGGAPVAPAEAGVGGASPAPASTPETDVEDTSEETADFMRQGYE